MAKGNRERVGDVLDILKDALAPYVLRSYRDIYRDKYLQEMEIAIYTPSQSYRLPDEAAAIAKLDVQAWLKLMGARWKDVFGRRLEQRERNYVSELQEYRNRWAHQETFSERDAHRCADTAMGLLEAIGAPEHARKVDEIAKAILRLRFEEEAKKSQKAPVRLDDVPSTTLQGLKTWRIVVEPHPDVAQGRFQQAEFAADLAQVVQGRASEEYSDPHEFFRRTYLTEGLLDLLATGVQRLTGKGGDPVVQLQTSFGGGKTHSMLALYHLFSGQVILGDIVGGERLQERVGKIDKTLEARRAVIVGTAFSATEPRRYTNVTTHTLWGEIAYQLGGIEAYHKVETADLTGVSPGSDTLLELFEAHGPALIIMDELVAFVRNLYGVTDRLPAGTFDANMTFMQALTEAVKRASDAMLLVSLPESQTELGSEGGERAFESIAKTVGRLESVWKPVTPTESFEIVRRRLFSSDTLDHAARDAVVDAFVKMYKKNKQDYPPHVSEAGYKQRLKDAYPIHPELFEQLYEKWSTLERFQRTRGVLRLMANVIYYLWMNQTTDLLIMPSSVPLSNRSVKDEILRYLPDGWSAVVDTDVSGDGSNPRKIDKENPTLNRYSASQRVAQAVFMGTAPNTAAQNVRGIEEVRVRLATIQPDEPLSVFNDALRRMSDQLSYLYRDDARYWYDTRPTLNRLAKDLAQQVSQDELHQEAHRRLRGIRQERHSFAAAHVAPQDTADVPDEDSVRVVVLSHEYAHEKGNTRSDAIQQANRFIETRGNAWRKYRNMLLFIVADKEKAKNWEAVLREYLAWSSINADKDHHNLDMQGLRQVESSLKRANETVESRLNETYCWLLVPTQRSPDNFEHTYSEYRLTGDNNIYARAGESLREQEAVIYRWSGQGLGEELSKGTLWQDSPHIHIKDLCEQFACYRYLPRLFNRQVLLDAIVDAVASQPAPFGYAEAVDGDKYIGLALGRSVALKGDADEVIVRPEVAQEQLERERPADAPALRIAQAAPTHDSPSAPVAKPKRYTRYYGKKQLDPHRIIREMNDIAENIVQYLNGLAGTTVSVTLEIRAQRPEGFDEKAQRDLKENSTTLKFDAKDFAED